MCNKLMKLKKKLSLFSNQKNANGSKELAKTRRKPSLLARLKETLLWDCKLVQPFWEAIWQDNPNYVKIYICTF